MILFYLKESLQYVFIKVLKLFLKQQTFWKILSNVIISSFLLVG